MVYSGMTLRQFERIAEFLSSKGLSPAFVVDARGAVDYITEPLRNEAKTASDLLNLPILSF